MKLAAMNKSYILTKQEIADAIVFYIGVHKDGSGFFPYKITGTDQELHIPKDVMFHLEYIPRGTKTEDVKHAI